MNVEAIFTEATAIILISGMIGGAFGHLVERFRISWLGWGLAFALGAYVLMDVI